MYDVIVVGGGHAGIEAALAPARMKQKTVLITANFDNVGSLPCNTSIGGPAKGIIVREIDALGGQMAKTADETYLQMKMLNTAKGPGVQSLRAQADKKAYPRYMQAVLKKQDNLDIIEGMVEYLMVVDNCVKGVILASGQEIIGKTVILTTGTYLKAEILCGDQKHASGPDDQEECKYLSTRLKELGLRIQRLKTGTPPRVEINSVDYSKTSLQPGSDAKLAFSYQTNKFMPIDEQVPCYLTYTNEKTHKIIKDNLHRSSMYGGYVSGVGPRYCPSIEDKVVRFNDKESHQTFIEPEGLDTKEMYIQGISTSLPYEVQIQMYRSMKGLENCKIMRPAYAIEYDCLNPTQLKASLEIKVTENLFSAGQFNGTSGYEEAAAQGLMAGINAARKIQGKEPFILDRSEAYIGVLIDDLITKGTNEPYRMMTSRAEYRLYLRQDNADMRLTEKGYEIGLASQERYDRFLTKKALVEAELERLKTERVTPKEVNELLAEKGASEIKVGLSLYDFLKRPEVTYELLEQIGKAASEEVPYDVKEQCVIMSKYEGYIDKQLKQIDQFKKLENKKLSEDIDYSTIEGLRIEARQKLNDIKPISIGQASRISGVSPADISVLLIYLEQMRRTRGGNNE